MTPYASSGVYEGKLSSGNAFGEWLRSRGTAYAKRYTRKSTPANSVGRMTRARALRSSQSTKGLIARPYHRAARTAALAAGDQQGHARGSTLAAPRVHETHGQDGAVPQSRRESPPGQHRGGEVPAAGWNRPVGDDPGRKRCQPAAHPPARRAGPRRDRLLPRVQCAAREDLHGRLLGPA